MMTQNEIVRTLMPQCSICSSPDDLHVWKLEDPYYGYGHYPTLICSKCPGIQKNWWSSHPYNPRTDDRQLGVTTCTISSCYLSNLTYTRHLCQKPVKDECGHDYVGDNDAYYCLDCFDSELKRLRLGNAEATP